MLRWISLFAATAVVVGQASAANMPDGYGKAPRHGRIAPIEEESNLLFTPPEAFPRVHFPPHTPILLGSSTLPGYYGSSHSYYYQGPYYGGENIDFRFRLPYACGVLGYC
jgi:hypothetical protein